MFAGVRLTHPDRVLFPDEGITKRDLAIYYTVVADFMLPGVVGRPLSLVRCPEGSGKPCFFQKHLGDTMPAAVRGILIKEKEGDGTYIIIDDLAGLISFVQMGVLEIHPWGSREDQIDRPDRLIFDIDPAPDVTWVDVVEAARHVKERLGDLGLESFVRTTGGKGLHVVAPIARRTSWEDLKALAKAFADALVREQPERYIAQSSKAKRAGKIFIDYLRNEKGATAVASYSTRAHQGATVATPLAWDELTASLKAGQFNTRTVPERLEKMKHDPWHDFFDRRQTITRGMQSAGREVVKLERRSGGEDRGRTESRDRPDEQDLLAVSPDQQSERTSCLIHQTSLAAASSEPRTSHRSSRHRSAPRSFRTPR